MYTTTGEELVQAVVKELKARKTICLGCRILFWGRLSALLTSVSGTDVFPGAIVSYSNDVKMSLLKVNEDTLNRHGQFQKRLPLRWPEQRSFSAQTSVFPSRE